MGSTPLVESDINKGKSVVEALEREHITVKAALWRYSSESDKWQLLVATPLVDQKGPREAYKAVEKVLTSTGESVSVPLWQISVASPTATFVQGLRQAIKTKEGGIRLTNSVINNFLIEDAYIYRST
jgi:hypothetical protein